MISLQQPGGPYFLNQSYGPDWVVLSIFSFNSDVFSTKPSKSATWLPFTKVFHFVSRIKYWLDGPVGLSLASIGMVLNLIAIVMLARQRVQRNFHMLMIFLSFWDLAYLVLSISLFALPIMSTSFRENIFVYITPYTLPLAQICLSGSCFSTVALTIER
jgi:ABC-type maltose transport system permease subunit